MLHWHFMPSTVQQRERERERSEPKKDKQKLQKEKTRNLRGKQGDRAIVQQRTVKSLTKYLLRRCTVRKHFLQIIYRIRKHTIHSRIR